MQTTSLDTVAHLIQLALTPVFLLSGLATLLSAFATRLGRVADRVNALAAEARARHESSLELVHQLQRLIHRSVLLDAAVVVASLGGIATCGATLVLFVASLRDSTAGTILFGLFGFAVVCTIVALGMFVAEMLLAGRGMRLQAALGKELAAKASEQA